VQQVRFKLAWQSYRVGDVISPPGVLRDWLASRGYVEPVPEVAAVEPPSEPESPAAPKQGRGRSRRGNP
jgi:hypothetical protein